MPVYFRAEPPVRERLKKELELKSERELAAHFGSDSVQLLVKYHQERFRQSAHPRYFYDMFGNKYQRVYCGEQSIEAVVEPVLQGAESPADLGRVAWPEPGLVDMKVATDAADYAGFMKVNNRFHEFIVDAAGKLYAHGTTTMMIATSTMRRPMRMDP